MKNKYTSKTVVLEENTLFENSREGARGYNLAQLDVPVCNAKQYFGDYKREKLCELPELSEPEIVRHYTRLSTWNYAIDLGIYPLGSCTMKYNPRFNEAVARSEALGNLHPYDPVEWSQGHLQIMHELQEDLKEITGLATVCLQPSAGAQGEFVGLKMISAYHEAKNQKRNIIITPDTSHGTNPASATLAGFKTIQIKTDSDGCLCAEAVKAALSDDVAAVMITNPNTLGFFEKHISKISEYLKEKDVLLYVDGANMNALLGISRPSAYAADVIHFNLHKTFTTPHGGGGPGSGPIAISERLIPFLPIPKVEKNENHYFLDYDIPKSVGRVKSFYGNFGMFIRAWCYIRALGGVGLRQVSENAILNANYIKAKLKDVLNIPVDGHHLHEVVFNDKHQKESGLDTTKIAKALIDYGIHPPTVHFPLCVKNALMVEPTETETQAEMDRFIDSIKSILTNDFNVQFPQNAFREKIDEVKAVRELKLVE